MSSAPRCRRIARRTSSSSGTSMNTTWSSVSSPASRIPRRVSAWEAVRGYPSSRKPALGVRLVQPLGHHFRHQVVTHQLARLHDASHAPAELAPVRHRLAQHVAGRDGGDPELARQRGRLGSLARSGGPRNTTRRPAVIPAPTDPPALHEPVVVAHDELALDLLQGVHRDPDHDQERGAAEEEVEAQTLRDPRRHHRVEARADPGDPVDLEPGDQELGQHRHRRQVERADDGEPGQDAVDVLRGAPSGPDAGDEPAVLAHVLGQVGGIEDDRHVEVREEDDRHHVEQVVDRLAPLQRVGHRLQPVDVDHARDGLRDGHHRAGEDDRDDAAGVEAQRQVGALPAVHAASDHPLGVLHRDPALGPLHPDDEGDHQHHEDDQQEHLDDRQAAGLDLLDRPTAAPAARRPRCRRR